MGRLGRSVGICAELCYHSPFPSPHSNFPKGPSESYPRDRLHPVLHRHLAQTPLEAPQQYPLSVPFPTMPRGCPTQW